MAIPFSEFPENPLNFKKFKKHPKNEIIEKRKKINPKLSSVWAFLSSIFIYISVFYIFNLSPSTLIFTTKFWFFISNTLVLIIAVDFTAFSSTKPRDFHDEHVIKDTTATSSKSNIIVSIYENHAFEDTTATSSKSNTLTVSTTYEKHMIKDTTATSPKGNAVVPLETTTSHDMEQPEADIINAADVDVDSCHQKKRQKCERSNSAAAVDEEAGRAMILHRTLSERHDREEQILEDDKTNEFSRMSNEELNRRVEEFIRRFNRQIRLQAVKNRQNLEINKIH